MWQRFSERARKVVFYAQEEAQKFGEGYVSTEHLLLGLMREKDNLACRCLTEMGVSTDRDRTEVQRQLPRGDPRTTQDMTITPRAKRVIDLAYDEARNLTNNYIGTEHLLLGIVREGDGLGGRVLKKLGLELEACRQTVARLQGERPQDPSPPPRVAAYRADNGDALLSFLMGASLPDHLTLAFIADEDGIVGRAIRSQCSNIGGLQWALWHRILLKPRSLCSPEPEVLVKTLQRAAKEAGDAPVKAEHMFLALIAEGTAFGVWVARYGITIEKSRELIANSGEED